VRREYPHPSLPLFKHNPAPPVPRAVAPRRTTLEATRMAAAGALPGAKVIVVQMLSRPLSDTH
jgi:hypothetical protein